MPRAPSERTVSQASAGRRPAASARVSPEDFRADPRRAREARRRHLFILTALTEAGFVDRTDVGDHVWRFELRRESGESTHPHFMCIECNVVQCLPRESVQVSSRVARGVTEIQVKGRCGDCFRR